MDDSLKPSDIFDMSAMSAKLKQAYEEMKSAKDVALTILEIFNVSKDVTEYFKSYISMLEMIVDVFFGSYDLYISDAEEEIFNEDT